LRLYVTDASNDGGSVYSTASTWTELGISWNNAPPPGVFYASASAQPINSYIEVPLPAGIFSTGNGTYSFVVISSSTDSAFYSSREGAIPPQLLLNQGGAVPPPPVADFSATPLSGAAPLTVAFNSNSSTGNPTSWNWDFQNDGSIDSTAQNPTYNYSSAGIYSIKFTVTNATGINSLTKANYITVSPSITSFSPSSGPAGTQVTLTGTGLTGTTAVKFSGIAATTFTVDSGTQLRATVPATATSGKIGVTSGGVTGASLTDFTVIVTPAIISFSPTSGPPGTQVTLTGTSFTGATAVAFNGTAASSFTLDSDTQIRASVPAGATTGKITVVNAAGSGVSAGNFTVPPPPTVTFLAVADAYVKSTSPASNYGTLDNLRVRTESGTGTVNYRSYLKFTVSGLTGTVTSAKLRLYVTDASNDGGSVYSTATTWTESDLTWNTAPLPGTLVAAAGAVPLGTYIEIVLPASLFSSGNGSYSLVLISSSTDSAIYNSRESANP
ncbi:MAG: DNRLRE domain-containing protein, partial [Chloroflexota bacterium]